MADKRYFLQRRLFALTYTLHVFQRYVAVFVEQFAHYDMDLVARVSIDGKRQISRDVVFVFKRGLARFRFCDGGGRVVFNLNNVRAVRAGHQAVIRRFNRVFFVRNGHSVVNDLTVF